MAFKRALWHSGLTYQQKCYHCQTLIRYTDYNLDFRPWYADGFVYCPRCNAPVRHNEYFAINEDGSPYYYPPQPTNPQQPTPDQTYQQQPMPDQTYQQQPMPQQSYQQQPFQQQPMPQQQIQPQETPPQNQGICPDCGKTYIEGVDRFCSYCGKKLVP